MDTCVENREIDSDLEHRLNQSGIRKTMQTLPVINNLDDLIRELHGAFATDSVNVDYVEYLMKSYKSNPIEWKKYAKFDRFRYTRNLVDKGNDKFNLMILCWGEGHGSAIHDHADAHCFMKMLQGQLLETRFHWPKFDGEPLEEMRRTILEYNGVCYINDSLGLHRVENPSHTEPAVSLHLYSPPFDKCGVFNKQTGQKTTSKMTFWSEFGERRNKELQEKRAPEDN